MIRESRPSKNHARLVKSLLSLLKRYAGHQVWKLCGIFCVGTVKNMQIYVPSFIKCSKQLTVSGVV